MSVRNKAVAILFAASALGLAGPASATVYDFNISLGSLTGNGTFSTVGDASTTPSLVNTFLGTFNGSSISLLAPNAYPTFPGPPNDNLFSETAPYFNYNGLSFTAGGTNYNIFSNPQGGLLDYCSGVPTTCYSDGATASFSFRSQTGAVPEPATWAIMLLGFSVMGIALRADRRVRRVKLA